MRLLEHESKRIFREHGIPTPQGQTVSSPEEISWKGGGMVKAQIPMGGRGKAGGIKKAEDADAVKRAASALLGTTIRGCMVDQVLVEERLDAAGEHYAAVTYDTAAKRPVIIYTPRGGVDVEDAARELPGAVTRRHFGIIHPFEEHHAREMASQCGTKGSKMLTLSSTLYKLSSIFLQLDATLVEINPLIETPDGRFIAADARIEVDDDALFRHPELEGRYGIPRRESSGKVPTPFERRAAEIDGMDYRGVAGRVIEFDGNMGLLIGGGGASLTAFDAIRSHGGRPANYCEIGGNPSVKKVKELTKLILTRDGVEKIAVIMNVVSNTRVDLVARGVIKGVLELGGNPSEKVAVFRIPGSWEDEGFRLLRKYGIRYCDRSVSIDEAARIAVAAFSGERR